MGECDNNAVFMLAECRKACGCRTPQPEANAAAACVDRDKSGACAQWAAAGECEVNQAFMKLRCAASCNSCDWLDYKKRCPMPENRTEAVPPGQMTKTFERALADFGHLEPTVHSRDPWVVSFDKFLTEEEVRPTRPPTAAPGSMRPRLSWLPALVAAGSRGGLPSWRPAHLDGAPFSGGRSDGPWRGALRALHSLGRAQG